MTAEAGVAARHRVGAGTCFLDIEGDGNLDLYVANYRPDDIRDRGRVSLYREETNGIEFLSPSLFRVRVPFPASVPPGEYVAVEVEDTGIGIAPESQAILFRAFEQADGSIARRYEGTGLGLALVRQMAELHGGTAEVASERPFRSFLADWTPFAGDLEPGRGEEEVDRDELIETMKAYLARRQLTADWRDIASAANEMLVNALSVALGVPATRIHEIVKERRAVTADTAARLAKYFGGDAASWLDAEVGLGSAESRVVTLELAATSATRGARVLFGDPMVVTREIGGTRSPRARAVIVGVAPYRGQALRRDRGDPGLRGRAGAHPDHRLRTRDRKSTRLNSSHRT